MRYYEDRALKKIDAEQKQIALTDVPRLPKTPLPGKLIKLETSTVEETSAPVARPSKANKSNGKPKDTPNKVDDNNVQSEVELDHVVKHQVKNAKSEAKFDAVIKRKLMRRPI